MYLHTLSLHDALPIFLLETHSKIPDYMRFSIRILTLLFDAWSYPIKGKPFHRLPLSQRIYLVAAWENSRLEFRHGLIVFYRSFATFGLYSILYGQYYEWSECRERHCTPPRPDVGGNRGDRLGPWRRGQIGREPV